MLIELFVVAGIGALMSLGMLAYYQPKINKLKKRYEEFSQKVRDNINNMPEQEREKFFSKMSGDTASFFQDILHNNIDFSGIDQFQESQMYFQQMNDMQDQQFQEFTNWAMDESMKSVTAFDHGGYVQGAGFNPSDTMAHQMNQDMDFGNNSMDSGFDNSMNFPDNF